MLIVSKIMFFAEHISITDQNTRKIAIRCCLETSFATVAFFTCNCLLTGYLKGGTVDRAKRKDVK
jgi:hypothetical protein